MIIKDMPKLESVFFRKEIGEDFIVTDEINPECKWVFEGTEEEVLCTEKLDGTDVSIVIENGKITRIFNRTNEIPFFSKNVGNRFIVEGILNSYERGYCNFTDGQYFGELVGPKIQGNPLQLTEYLWLPFNSYVRENLTYNSFHKYPKTFENLKNWLLSPIEEGGIFSLYLKKRGIIGKPEGVVFHNVKTGQMCKLRIDMFEEFKGKRHKE